MVLLRGSEGESMGNKVMELMDAVDTWIPILKR